MCKKIIVRLGKNIKKYFNDYPEVKFVFFLFVILTALVVAFTLLLNRQYRDSFLDNILAEMHGLSFDILIFGILIVIYNLFLKKKRDIALWKAEIDDYRYARDPSATRKIVENIRRLNRFNVHEFILHSCYLKNALLRSADLHGNTILTFVVLEGADLTDADLRGVDLRNAEMEGAILEIAKLNNANFAGAILRKAHFCEANLGGANLCGADMRGALSLNIKQLSKTLTLYDALLDAPLEAQVREQCPELLKEPKKKI